MIQLEHCAVARINIALCGCFSQFGAQRLGNIRPERDTDAAQVLGLESEESPRILVE